jgi:Tfp pilus assembly protein PilO
MRVTYSWSIRILDALCGCVVIACLSGFLWLTILREDGTKDEIETLKRVIHQAQQDRFTIIEDRRQQLEILADRQRKLEKTGRLPTETPVEEYFQTLAGVVSKHRLRVVKHHPLSTREYPDLLEQRYAYEVIGRLPDLVAFLRSIENTGFWADVSYLKVDPARGRKEAVPDERVASLTISLFSAPEADEPSDGGGA